MRSDFSIDNQSISIAVTRLQSGPQTTIPLVVVPGITESAADYAGELIGWFPRDVIIVDLRGRGRSNAPPTGYTFDDQLSDLDAVID